MKCVEDLTVSGLETFVSSLSGMVGEELERVNGEPLHGVDRRTDTGSPPKDHNNN